MTVAIEVLRESLQGKQLPGGEITIQRHEAFIGDKALRSAADPDGLLNPTWFVIASLRCMGITVNELGELAQQEDGDTLLFGRCRVAQNAGLRADARYSASATVGTVDSRRTRNGDRLDSIEVTVRLADARTGASAGEITSTYLFKRGVAE